MLFYSYGLAILRQKVTAKDHGCIHLCVGQFLNAKVTNARYPNAVAVEPIAMCAPGIVIQKLRYFSVYADNKMVRHKRPSLVSLRYAVKLPFFYGIRNLLGSHRYRCHTLCAFGEEPLNIVSASTGADTMKNKILGTLPNRPKRVYIDSVIRLYDMALNGLVYDLLVAQFFFATAFWVS